MRKWPGRILWIATLMWFGAAPAQLVPQVQLPGAQLPALPIDPALRGAGEALRNLPARAVRADQLLAQHRAELDRDPRGDLVVRAEVVAVDITDSALAKALQADFLVKRTQELAGLGVKITVLQTPQGWSASRGLKRLRKLDPLGTYDFNHVYLDSGEFRGAPRTAEAVDGGAPRGPKVRIGLIDGGVDASHAALHDNTLHRFGCNGRIVPDPHGTGVASLLAGSAAGFAGAAPHAELYSADVYCGEPTGGAVDAIAAALEWMAQERVAVVNVSLVGPRNSLLQHLVKILVSRGYLIVAAVGNDGAAAPPLYPAAYPGVIGVTAVDARHHVLLEACRGKHLDLAAPGTDFNVAAAGTPDSYIDVRGTSFAAPIVAGLLARELREPDPAASERVLAALLAQAEDLGPKGRDDIYGAGLVGSGLPENAIK